MTRFAQYAKGTGRIVSVAEYAEPLEMIEAGPGVSDATHYVGWTDTDANGRPVDPEIRPRELLAVEVAEGEGLSTVRYATGRPLVVLVDGKPQPPEDPVGGWVVVELECRVPRRFTVEVDEIDRYCPRLEVRVT